MSLTTFSRFVFPTLLIPKFPTHFQADLIQTVRSKLFCWAQKGDDISTSTAESSRKPSHPAPPPIRFVRLQCHDVLDLCHTHCPILPKFTHFGTILQLTNSAPYGLGISELTNSALYWLGIIIGIYHYCTLLVGPKCHFGTYQFCTLLVGPSKWSSKWHDIPDRATRSTSMAIGY